MLVCRRSQSPPHASNRLCKPEGGLAMEQHCSCVRVEGWAEAIGHFVGGARGVTLLKSECEVTTPARANSMAGHFPSPHHSS